MAKMQSLVALKDERVFEALFKAHFRELAAYAYQYLRDADQAEEIVQELFSQLWQKGESLEITSNLRAYLYGSVRNACLNQLKHDKVKEKHAKMSIQRDAQFSGIDDAVSWEQLNEAIAAAFEKLPEKCRAIFELSRLDGKKYHEIAEILNISIKTVENQMGKALRIMRDELKDYLPAIISWWWLIGVKMNWIVTWL